MPAEVMFGRSVTNPIVRKARVSEDYPGRVGEKETPVRGQNSTVKVTGSWLSHQMRDVTPDGEVER